MRICVFAPDCYIDIVPAFEYLLDKHWSTHPPLVYVCNKLKPKTSSLWVNIKGKPDIAFGWRLRKFITNHYDDELMLVTMVDYLVRGANARVIDKAAQLCASPTIGHVRLRPMPHPQLPYPDKDFGEIKKGSSYSLSLQPGIWEAKLLHDLVRDEEDPWRVEVNGSRRLQRGTVKKKFLSVQKMVLPHHNYYRKRKAQGVGWVKENVPQELWPKEARKR